MSRPVYMKVGHNRKCMQVIPSLNLIRKTSLPTSWMVQQELGKPRFWEHVTEEVFDEKLWETLTEIKNI